MLKISLSLLLVISEMLVILKLLDFNSYHNFYERKNISWLHNFNHRTNEYQSLTLMQHASIGILTKSHLGDVIIFQKLLSSGTIFKDHTVF